MRAALPRALAERKLQLAVHGAAKPRTRIFFRWLARAHPAASRWKSVSEELTHRIQPVRFLLMPSLFEPCG
jgi:glycogen synthase